MLGYAIVGCGYVAERHVRAAMNMADTSVAVLCDANLESARNLAAKCGLDCDMTADMDEAIGREDVQVVVIGLPTRLHLQACEAAADAGKHIYMEKPIAQTLIEAQRMMEVCAKAGVKMVVGHSHRYFPVLKRAREMVINGDLGKIVKIRSVLCYYSDFAGESRKWKLDASTELHGALLDVGVHAADDIRFVSDSPVTRVYAEGGSFRPEECPLTEVGSAVMRLANGAVAQWEISETQATGGKFPCQNGTEVYGTQGSLLISGDNLSIFRQDEADPEKAYTEEAHKPEAFLRIWEDLHRDFVSSILQDEPVPIPPQAGYDALRVVDAVFRSIRNHEVIDLTRSE
jgi:predicted dehydrogenase